MAKLSEIVTWLDTYLETSTVPDYPNAYNGLQVENSGEVNSVASSVDASLESIKKAAELGVDLLIVHHGLYWQGVEMLKGAWKEKCQLLLDNNIALYSSHIPLDVHPEVGNNILLAKALGLTNITPCLPWKGIHLCQRGDLSMSRGDLIERLAGILGTAPKVCAAGPETIDHLYIITGGAGSEIIKIRELGGRNFLTGEGSHWNMVYAQEEEMNFFLGTHYLTETLGIEALVELTRETFTLGKSEKIRSQTFL